MSQKKEKSLREQKTLIYLLKAKGQQAFVVCLAYTFPFFLTKSLLVRPGVRS